MNPLATNAPAPALAADDQYQEYKRRVSIWIDNFLQEQRNYIDHLPNSDADNASTSTQVVSEASEA